MHIERVASVVDGSWSDELRDELGRCAMAAAPMFEANAWTWATLDGPKVPDEWKIRTHLIGLTLEAVQNARKDKRGYAKFSAGRLYAQADIGNDTEYVAITYGVEYPL